MKSFKNTIEDINERTVLEGIKGLTPELRKTILDAPEDQHRKLIFKVMVDNNIEHRLLGDKIEEIIENNSLYSTRHIKTVVKLLRKYVEVSATEVKTMGEVMTPTSLVIDMLDTLPKDVWSNPDLKWLDPCNGVGIFPAIIIDRLMEGLIEFEPNEELRYKHIMEEMIYVSELQAKNLFLYLYAFDPEDRFEFNVYNGSYLDSGFDVHMNVLGVDKFDIVVMNPPYQEQKEGNKKTQTLWDKFVIKTVENLVEAGYLVAVHPSGWRNVGGSFKNIQTLLKSKQLTYLEIHNEKDGLKTFGAETRYDFYCLHNVPNTMFTKIKCQDGTTERVDISEMEFIPNGMYKTFEKLIPKNGEETVKIIGDSSYHTQRIEQMSKIQTTKFNYPCIYTVKGGDVLTLWYSNINTKGHFNIPKLVWSNFRISSAGSYVDMIGNYGLTQFSYAIVDKTENLNRIKEAFDNKDFRNLMEACSIADMKINSKVIATFRKDFWKEFI